MVIEFKRNKKQKRVNCHVGRILVKKGIAKVITEDGLLTSEPVLIDEPVVETITEVADEVAEPENEIPLAETLPANSDGLDELSRAELLKMVDDLEINIDRRSGADKIIAIIRERMQ